MQVLTAWQIPYMSVTKAGATAEEMTATRDAKDEAPKVMVVSITAVDKEETKRFLRRQKVLVVAVDEAQACAIAKQFYSLKSSFLHYTDVHCNALQCTWPSCQIC